MVKKQSAAIGDTGNNFVAEWRFPTECHSAAQETLNHLKALLTKKV